MCVCKLAPFQFVWHSFSVSWTQASIIDREVKTIFHLQVLSCVLDPLLQMCTVSASNLGTADMATFMVNSLYMMKTTLALFEFTDRRLEMLQFQVRFALKWLLTAMESLFCMWPQLTGFDLIPLNPLLSDRRPHTCTHTCMHARSVFAFSLEKSVRDGWDMVVRPWHEVVDEAFPMGLSGSLWARSRALNHGWRARFQLCVQGGALQRETCLYCV